jgi:hypothetical protein
MTGMRSSRAILIADHRLQRQRRNTKGIYCTRLYISSASNISSGILFGWPTKWTLRSEGVINNAGSLISPMSRR